jgi:predicted transcriptional regulator
MTKTVTIRISKELKKELEKISREENKPVSDIVRDSLNTYLSLLKFRRLRNKTLPFAESSGLLTDEDVFQSIS